MNYTSIFFDSVINLLYPQLCLGCGSGRISGKQIICLDCADALPVTDFHLYRNNPAAKVFVGRIPVEHVSAHAYFNKHSVMQNLLHQLKYKGKKEIGLYFGRRMGEALKGCDKYNEIDALVPLPLFYKRERKRGYNQAAVLCEGISEIMNVPVFKNILVRKENTATQTHKSREERWQNIEGKFELVNEEAVSGKHVLLVDDVLTTGATLEACGRELLKAGNLKLSIATLAYTSL
ncbi:MAG: ComF family protein [Chitinophagaceae bacterium]|nr:ComF family protein [Chitinophagaceae bacterium]